MSRPIASWLGASLVASTYQANKLLVARAHGSGLLMLVRTFERPMGLAVVDLCSGQTVAFLEFQTAVEEIFDVQLLPGIRFPEVIGFQNETVHHTFIIPSEDRAATRS